MFEFAVVQQAKQEVVAASQAVVKYSKRYGKKNPKMIAARANLEKNRANYLVLLKNIAKSIIKKYNAARAHESSLKIDLKMSKDNIRSINKKSFKLKEYERDVDTNRQLYDTFFTRFKETNETTEMQSSNARIIDYAVIPKNPVKPKKKLISLIVFILSLGLGIVLSFLNESLNTTLKSPDDVQLRMSTPLLGVLPQLKLKKRELDSPLLEFVNNSKSTFSEAVRTIRTGVILSGLDSDLKIAMVTSSVPNEGKTTVSLNLAMSIGTMEKVLLIDADLRRPSIAKALNISSKYPGLSSLVAGTNEFAECITKFPDWNIDVLAAGITPPNPQELLASKRFEAVLKALGKHYDRIIIDTPPTQAVSDSLLISKYANEIIYLVKADSTSYLLARSGIDKLESVNGKVTGIILNQLNFDRSKKYSYDYYNGYYSNYGYS